MKILVVDDEALLVKGIKFNLENEGYQVDTASDGAAALAMASANDYDLLILDIMMPQVSGIEVCMKVREFSTVPIIMLTAKSEDADKLMGFESGADDYITKPFNILELKARIRALLRRSAIRDQMEKEETISLHGISVDIARRTVEKDGYTCDLTGKEFDLIELFMRNPGRVYSRERLLDIIWGADYQGDIRTVDVHVHRLRDKLEADPSQPSLILTKWGVGYYLRP